ncbi:MAG: Smr/MutS family protein [Alphaproteobacteria bacterium]|nr:Smr/MutS family protein [Alphaproteobacteria bacterium]
MGKKGRDATEDAELFHRVLADVTPLKKHKDIAQEKPQPLKPPAKKIATPPARSVKQAAKPSMPHDLVLGETAGVDRRTADRFRRGRMAIEGRLDLHGLIQDEAHDALRGFIAGATSAGQRCVIVITGKGRVSEGGGVLRREVPKWLNQAGCRENILSVARAKPEHGGDGALYVLLKRRRNA